jgi:hypothetical protein
MFFLREHSKKTPQKQTKPTQSLGATTGVRACTMLGKDAFPCAFHVSKGRQEKAKKIYHTMLLSLRVISTALNVCIKIGVNNK